MILQAKVATAIHAPLRWNEPRQNSCRSETNQSILMDMAYGIVESRQQNGCFKKFEDVREAEATLLISFDVSARSTHGC